MPEVKFQIPLTDPQKEFLQSDSTNTFFVSGRGGGKSFASFLKILTLPPGSQVYYIEPTYRNIKDISIATLKKIAEKLYKHTRINIIKNERITDTEIELNNRTRIYFRGAENYEKLRGISTGYLFMDEAAAIAEAAWNIISATLREGDCRLWITTTPRGKLNWVYKFLMDNQEESTLIKASTTTNTFLRPSYYEKLKKQYTAAFALQELEAEFIDGGAIVNPEWIKYYDNIKFDADDYTILAIDPAISQSDTADYTAMVIATYKGGKYYIRHVYRDQITFRSIIERAQALYKTYKCSMAVIEDVAFQKALLQELQYLDVPSIGIKPHSDKVARFMNSAAKLEQGLIEINSQITSEYVDELIAFPNAEHDDFVDATAYAINYLEETCSYSEVIAVGRW